jgi:hypothetical protein
LIHLTIPYVDAEGGSEIVMQFILAPDSWTPEEAVLLTKVVQMVRELGEPWLTYFSPTRFMTLC